MDRNKALVFYILGTLGQIWAVCTTVFILRRSGMIVDYTSSIGMVAITIGGASSAIWGIIIAVKYRKCELKKILKDFLNVKQEYRSYLLVILFLCLEKLKMVWEVSAELGLENDIIVSPTVIPYDEFVKYKQLLPYYRNIAEEGKKIG